MTYAEPQMHIHSLALSFPMLFIRDLQAAHKLAEVYPALRLLYYGDTGILVISGAVFNPDGPVIWQAYTILISLMRMGIITQHLRIYHLNVHELELKYSFVYFQPFICRPPGFLRVNNRWLSTDFRRFYRRDGELKGSQKSFICVEPNRGGYKANLIFNFSGRKRRYLSMPLLHLSTPGVFNQLAPLSSIYLTQAASPNDFMIDPQYIPFLRPDFVQVFSDAGWFDKINGFVRKRVRDFNNGGALWSTYGAWY